MKKALFAAILLSPTLLCGQIDTLVEKEGRYGWIRRPSLGLMLNNDSTRALEVKMIGKNTPAERAGIKPHDRLIHINFDTINTTYDLFCNIYNRQPGEVIYIGLIRNNVNLCCTLKLGFFEWSIEEDAINILLQKGKAVRIAIIPGTMRTNHITDKVKLAEYEQDASRLVLANEENLLLNAFGNYPKFALIERMQIDDAIKELKISLTGQLSSKESVKVGELLGANYLLFVGSDASVMDNKVKDMSLIIKIIEVETGRIIASGIEAY